jgi:hypothetical protein
MDANHSITEHYQKGLIINTVYGITHKNAHDLDAIHHGKFCEILMSRKVSFSWTIRVLPPRVHPSHTCKMLIAVVKLVEFFLKM